MLLPLPLNYANIIALPLLLGVGVSFNIYFVMNWRAGQTDVLGSPTARAILFSASPRRRRSARSRCRRIRGPRAWANCC